MFSSRPKWWIENQYNKTIVNIEGFNLIINNKGAFILAFKMKREIVIKIKDIEKISIIQKDNSKLGFLVINTKNNDSEKQNLDLIIDTILLL